MSFLHLLNDFQGHTASQMNPEFSLLTYTTCEKYKEVITIYNELFPANERQPLDVIEERIVTGKAILLVAKVEGCVVGFAILWNFANSNFALLDYLAVDNRWRNKKIGTALMNEIKRMSINWGKNLILEIEHPSEGDNCEDREKRLRFYLDNGALILNKVPYMLPSLDGTNSTSMILMAIPVTEQICYSGSEIKRLIQLLYSSVYNKDSDDNELQAFINLVPETVILTNRLE